MTIVLTPPYVLIEDRLSRDRSSHLYLNPLTIINTPSRHTFDEAFKELERQRQLGRYLAGYFAYEAGSDFEPKLAETDRWPITPRLWMGVFQDRREVSQEELNELFSGLPPPPPLTQLTYGLSRRRHGEAVEKILSYIRSGDVYQANLTFPIRFATTDPLPLYSSLRARQPVAHGALIATGAEFILSISPELFFEIEGSRILTSPMKGTIARGSTSERDRENISQLASDAKELAENLMIVDLLRNDLSKLCVAGSVQCETLFKVETYPTFHAMTSTVSGQLKAPPPLETLFTALFPCGSIVGAPKIRAMQIIQDLERTPRGVYTGAIGAIAPNGNMKFNVAIRTALVTRDGQGCYGVGGGIVADSDPAREYQEALLKARVLTDLQTEYSLIETFRWCPSGGFIRLSRHLARLRRSASALGFVFDEERVGAELERLKRELPRDGPDQRVRLLATRDGAVTCSFGAVEHEAKPLHCIVWTGRLGAADPFLRHKTTRREAYDDALAYAQQQGASEALILNDSGRIADASRNTVFLRVGDRLLTPPVKDGALPGVFRAELIASGAAVEASLNLSDFRSRPLLLGNSLRGLRAAQYLAEG